MKKERGVPLGTTPYYLEAKDFNKTLAHMLIERQGCVYDHSLIPRSKVLSSSKTCEKGEGCVLKTNPSLEAKKLRQTLTHMYEVEGCVL